MIVLDMMHFLKKINIIVINNQVDYHSIFEKCKTNLLFVRKAKSDQ